MKRQNMEKSLEPVESYELITPFASVSIMRQSGNKDSEKNSEKDLEEYIYQVREPVLSTEKQKLFKRIISAMNDSVKSELFEEKRENGLTDAVSKILDLYSVRLSPEDFEIFLYYIQRDFWGFGPIQPILEDPNIEDISCSGSNIPIYVFHRKYGSVKTNRVLLETEADFLIRRMAQCSNKHISISNPMTDAVLPGGSRAHLTLGNEITIKGSTFTIRKFNEKPFLPSDLVENGTFAPEIMAYLWLCAESNMNLMFAGGTASGKTTSLNAVCRFIPPNRKIVSIEDTPEINLPHENWIAGVAREAKNRDSSVTLYDLLKAALRQRPEYILVGEIRGAEAYVLFQAMSTGHTTLSTMHAESVDTLIHRLENPPMNVPRVMIQTLDVLVILTQTGDGNLFYKKCLSVHEILETDPQTSEILTREIFGGNDPADVDITKSDVLEKVRRKKGWTLEKLEEEFNRRVRLFGKKQTQSNREDSEKEKGERKESKQEKSEREGSEREGSEREESKQEESEKEDSR